jgi:uncharacterized repeat protein (TIGR03803 family)
MSFAHLENKRSTTTHIPAVNPPSMFGIVLLLLCAVIQPASAQTLKVLYNFTNGTDGGLPNYILVRDPAGNLYGTTEEGGDISSSNCNPPQGCGTVFKVTPHGKETVIYDFKDNPDAAYPGAGLSRDAAGNFYGTTFLGGTSNMGTVYRLDKTGKETVLHSFTGGHDGGNPFSTVIFDPDGNLYGTTEIGGDTEGCDIGDMNGCGVVFKISPSGKFTVLHRFNGYDGADPEAGLIRDEAGNLYGTTTAGGVTSCHNGGCGTIFKIDPAGKETVLVKFKLPGTAGIYPSGPLIRDAAGNLYGTTEWGGDLSCNQRVGCGTVFKLDKTGKETVLYKFKLGADGGLPNGPLAQDADGNLYGTTSLGGILSCNGGDGCGVIFKLDTAGKQTTLYKFKDGSDGEHPNGGLVRDSAGNLYGTQPGNFATTWGSVFELTP